MSEKYKVSVAEAAEQLLKGNSLFNTVFAHGSLLAEIYHPVGEDYQQPHDRDEIYVIVAGTGRFSCDGEMYSFQPGDFFLVPAGKPHRFLDFGPDFLTWVFFYGPPGGEKP